jgi:hypothetical protein
VDQAEETLGVFLAPTGTLTGQLNKFNAKIQQWTEKLAAGRLSKSEMWTAVQSTILRTLAYPLPAINVTRPDWDKTLGPLLTTVLPRLGVCRQFPRAMVFAPTKYFGLGFRHLHTDQEIQRLKDLVFHTANDTITGRLYRASLELMHIELGSFLPLHRLSLELLGSLVTDSLIKSTWEFMSEHGLSLTADIKVELPRQDDCYLLPALQAYISDLNHLGIVNRCRLFLKALFLSDIVDGTGYEILQAAWNGDRVLGQHRLPSWPNQA